MGCGCPPCTIERENMFTLERDIKSNKNEKDVSFLLHRNLEKLIEKNPFYRKKISDFVLAFDSIKEKIPQDNNDIKKYNNKIIKETIETFLNEEESFVETLFSEVVKYALSNHNFDINNENNHQIIFIIISFIFIFLSENKAGKKELFRKNFLEILKIVYKNNEEKNNGYKIEKIFCLIINIIQMHSFFFETFFLYFSFSEIFKSDNINYENVINDNPQLIKFIFNINIKTFVESNLDKINENITLDVLNLLFVSEINNKIKIYFENGNEEGFITLDENQINIISDCIYEAMNINNFVKFLFFGENLIF